MNIVVFTGNQMRHRFVANTLAAAADDALIVSEVLPHDSLRLTAGGETPPAILEHFRLRYETEQREFVGHDTFHAPTIPLAYREANLDAIVDTVRRFDADMWFVFGASLLKEPIIAIGKPGRFVNCHLGLSPYYRGSGTNFWPFVNGELEYVGSTLLHLDPGIDTGDIICHVRPEFQHGDTVHTVGCRVIAASAAAMVQCLEMIRSGRTLPRVPQWKVPHVRYYRSRDFDEAILQRYYEQLAGGLVVRHLQGRWDLLKFIPLPAVTEKLWVQQPHN